jgi:uncharacterized protein
MSRSLARLFILMGCAAFFCCKTPTSVLYDTRSGSPAVREVMEHRQKKHAEFLSDKSPLSPDEKKKFKGLHYFPVDTAYRVTAKFIRTFDAPLFKMKTTTQRLPDYRKYAEVFFVLLGTEYRLEVYQSPDLMKQKEYEDYLFIPFTDATNGKETYEVGRYLEMRIPQGDQVVLDFNLCYNPYCSYSSRYSCPIPPAANQLPVEIRAGEMKYHD